MSKNQSVIIFVMMIFLLAIPQTALGAAPLQTSQYQDMKWLNLYTEWSKPIVKDLNDISAAANAADYDALRDAAQRLIKDEQAFLKKSKGLKVSPQLKNAKQEAETASTYDVKAAKYLLTGVSMQNKGDTAGKDKDFLTAARYTDISTEHTNKQIKYIETYNSNSKKSKSNYNSNSNAISNPPSKTNAGSGSIIANSNTHVYHNAGCRYVPEIHPEHLTYFNSRKEVEAAGYRACKVCGG